MFGNIKNRERKFFLSRKHSFLSFRSLRLSPSSSRSQLSPSGEAGGRSHIRSQSSSPTPTKEEKSQRKKSFRISFRKSSLFSRAGDEDEKAEREDGGYLRNISFLGQIYRNAKNRFSLTKSLSLSSSSSATELTKQ